MKKTFKSALALLFCIVTISTTMLMASAVGKPTVKVKSVTYNSVSLYWTTVSGADYYQIQRTTDGKKWTTLSSSVKATSYTDSKSLTTGKAYGYRVRAVDKGLLKTTYGSWTGMVTAKPLPAKVTGLKVKASNNTTVQLTWTKVAGATGYTVQFLSGSTWKNYKSTTGNALNVTNLTLGKTYSFRVRAYRTVSKKNYYGPVSATLKAGPTLNAPTTVALSSLSTTALKIQWNSAAGAKGYEIYNASTKKWTSTGTTKGIIIKNLKPGTKYSFIVRAYAGSLKGKQTKTYTFQTAPAAPTGLKAIDASDKTITFSWNKVTGAAGYQYQYYNHTTKKWSSAYTTTANSVKISNLTGNTNYGFKVRAYIKNSNVYKISATAYGAWAPTIAYKTVLPAPTVTAAAVNTNTIKVSWTAVSGAKGYTVEKYDSTRGGWSIYDFNSNKWRTNETLTETSVTTTTERSLSDTGAATRADVYRVRAIDTANRNGTLSATVNGRTSNVYISDTDKSGSRNTIFNLRQFIRWPKVAGAVTYRVYTSTPITEVYNDYAISELTDKGNYYEATMYFAPESIHSIMVIGLDANGQTINSATNWITFSIGSLPMYGSSHSYYKTTVNSQLLYVARAINNTKAYNGEITVKNNSQVSYSINSLVLKVAGISWINKKTPAEVEAFFNKYSEEDETLTTSSSETYNTTLTFNGGSAKNEEGKTVYLKYFLEPSSNATRTAYLYNSKNYTAWMKNIENVKTVKNSDGGYTISFTIKQETGNANYHSGFLSSFNAADFGAADGFNVQNLKIGKSTVTATIGPDGILKSYKATSPYSAAFAADFEADEDVDGEVNVSKGQLIEMNMAMSGNTNFNYTITK